MYVADIAHDEVMCQLKEGNSTKRLFSSSLAVHLGSLITPERNSAIGLVIAPPVWELTGFYPQNTPYPKKYQKNGHLPGVNSHSQSPATDPGSPRSKSPYFN
jgi:hypothetical protein